MKKLLYITRYSLDEEFNLKKKFDGQLSAFRNLGYDVYFIGFDRKHLYLVHNDEKTVYGKTHFGVPSYLHTQFYNDLHKSAIKAIKQKGIDVVYWRSAPIFSSSCKVAEAAKEAGARLIVEIPTFPSSKENNLTGIRKAFSVYSDHYSDRFSALVDAYVAIGENAHGEYNGKPAINMDNGIDVNSVPVRNPVNDKDTIHLLALASMSYWHGYERIIKSLGEVDYGLFSVLGGVMSVFVVLNSLEAATMRFITYEQGQGSDKARMHVVFSTAQHVHFAIAGIVLLLAETAGMYYVCNHLVMPPERLTAAIIVFQIYILTSIFGIICAPFDALIVAYEKMGVFASISIYNTLIREDQYKKVIKELKGRL